MIVLTLLLLFAIVVVVLGRTSDGVEDLYYDADYEQIDASDTDLGEDDIPADAEEVEAAVAVSADSGSGEVDASVLAREIYDSADL